MNTRVKTENSHWIFSFRFILVKVDRMGEKRERDGRIRTSSGRNHAVNDSPFSLFFTRCVCVIHMAHFNATDIVTWRVKVSISGKEKKRMRREEKRKEVYLVPLLHSRPLIYGLNSKGRKTRKSFESRHLILPSFDQRFETVSETLKKFQLSSALKSKLKKCQ